MTEQLFKNLRNRKRQIQIDWASSLYVGDTSDQTIQRNAAALGEVHAIEDLLELTFEEITENE